MEQPIKLIDRKLERLGQLAGQCRISPIQAFQDTFNLMSELQEGQTAEFKQALHECREALEELTTMKTTMLELATIFKQQDKEKKAVYRFLEKKGLKKEYERSSYKRQMNAIYRLGKKERVQ